MQKVEHFSPQQMPPLMSSSKYVMSPDLLGLTGTNCPADNFTQKLNSTCTCLPNINGFSKSWTPNSNYGDMYICQ
jgi:hypothetical protein